MWNIRPAQYFPSKRNIQMIGLPIIFHTPNPLSAPPYRKSISGLSEDSYQFQLYSGHIYYRLGKFTHIYIYFGDKPFCESGFHY